VQRGNLLQLLAKASHHLQGALADAVTGIYAGWASVGSSPLVYKMAMSIGYNPVFQNKVRGHGNRVAGFQAPQSTGAALACCSLCGRHEHELHGKGWQQASAAAGNMSRPACGTTAASQSNSAKALRSDWNTPKDSLLTAPGWLQEKTAEPWLLHDFGPDWSCLGQELRLVVCAYIRPEANFESLQASGGPRGGQGTGGLPPWQGGSSRLSTRHAQAGSQEGVKLRWDACNVRVTRMVL